MKFSLDKIYLRRQNCFFLLAGLPEAWGKSTFPLFLGPQPKLASLIINQLCFLGDLLICLVELGGKNCFKWVVCNLSTPPPYASFLFLKKLKVKSKFEVYELKHNSLASGLPPPCSLFLAVKVTFFHSVCSVCVPMVYLQWQTLEDFSGIWSPCPGPLPIHFIMRQQNFTSASRPVWFQPKWLHSGSLGLRPFLV